jgi:hypothetical protein
MKLIQRYLVRSAGLVMSGKSVPNDSSVAYMNRCKAKRGKKWTDLLSCSSMLEALALCCFREVWMVMLLSVVLTIVLRGG